MHVWRCMSGVCTLYSTLHSSILSSTYIANQPPTSPSPPIPAVQPANQQASQLYSRNRKRYLRPACGAAHCLMQPRLRSEYSTLLCTLHTYICTYTHAYTHACIHTYEVCRLELGIHTIFYKLLGGSGG